MNEIDIQKKKEMYMVNARILRWGPNAAYIPLTRVGVCVGVTQILTFALGVSRIFRYQHVGIANVNFRVGSAPQREAPKPVVLRRSGIYTEKSKRLES